MGSFSVRDDDLVGTEKSIQVSLVPGAPVAAAVVYLDSLLPHLNQCTYPMLPANIDWKHKFDFLGPPLHLTGRAFQPLLDLDVHGDVDISSFLNIQISTRRCSPSCKWFSHVTSVAWLTSCGTLGEMGMGANHERIQFKLELECVVPKDSLVRVALNRAKSGWLLNTLDQHVQSSLSIISGRDCPLGYLLLRAFALYTFRWHFLSDDQ